MVDKEYNLERFFRFSGKPFCVYVPEEKVLFYSVQDVEALKQFIEDGNADKANEMIAYYRDMSESEYERLKEMVWKGAKMKTGIMKYHPSFIAQRKMQKELQDKGYNDIFIPNLMVLSP